MGQITLQEPYKDGSFFLSFFVYWESSADHPYHLLWVDDNKYEDIKIKIKISKKLHKIEKVKEEENRRETFWYFKD